MRYCKRNIYCHYASEKKSITSYKYEIFYLIVNTQTTKKCHVIDAAKYGTHTQTLTHESTGPYTQTASPGRPSV